MLLWLVRICFIIAILAAFLTGAWAYFSTQHIDPGLRNDDKLTGTLAFTIVLLIAGIAVTGDLFVRHKQITTISAVYFGLLLTCERTESNLRITRRYGCGAAVCSRGVRVHCPSRLGTAATVLATELLCGDEVSTKWALERSKAVDHLDDVMSHSFNCSDLSRHDSEPKLPSLDTS